MATVKNSKIMPVIQETPFCTAGVPSHGWHANAVSRTHGVVDNNNGIRTGRQHNGGD